MSILHFYYVFVLPLRSWSFGLDNLSCHLAGAEGDDLRFESSYDDGDDRSNKQPDEIRTVLPCAPPVYQKSDLVDVAILD